MAVERRPYLAYMLRLWQAGGSAGPVWCASLESPHSGERHAFASLAALAAFLETVTRDTSLNAENAAGSAERSPAEGD